MSRQKEILHPRTGSLRTMLCGLPLFLSHYLLTGTDEIVDPEGETWNLHDLLHLQEITPSLLTERQAHAVALRTWLDQTEVDAGLAMGLAKQVTTQYALKGISLLAHHHYGDPYVDRRGRTIHRVGSRSGRAHLRSDKRPVPAHRQGGRPDSVEGVQPEVA